MFQYFAEFADSVTRTRDITKTRALNPDVQTLDQWRERNKGKIPLE
ncbi:MAG: hypothetical protein ACR2GJ_10000 [Gemmatimonadaceae bacterium]